VRSLARSGGLGRLRVLSLFNDNLSAASAEALIGSPALPNVCFLSFPYRRLDESTRRRLVSHFGDRV
jgi:hypothetical protein